MPTEYGHPTQYKRGGRRYADTPNVATAAPRRHRFRCGIGASFDLQRYVAYLGTVRPDDVVIVGVRIVAVRQPCVHVARLACPVHGKLQPLRPRRLIDGVPEGGPVPLHHDLEAAGPRRAQGGRQPDLGRYRRGSLGNFVADGGRCDGEGVPAAVSGRSSCRSAVGSDRSTASMQAGGRSPSSVPILVSGPLLSPV